MTTTTVASDSPAEVTRIPIRFVATTKTDVSNKKEGIILRQLLPDGSLGPEQYWEYRSFKGKVRPGIVYDIDSPDGDPLRLYVSNVRYVEPWPDQKERLMWRAEAQAYDTARAAVAAAKKEETRNTIEEVMEPLRRIWNETNHQNRRALEVLVLHYLRTGTVNPESRGW